MSAPLIGWGLLTVTIAFEIAGTTMLKLADGFAKPQWFFGAIACYCVCFAIMTLVLRYLPLGVTYAIWAGAGAALIVVIDALLFDGTYGALKLIGICLIIAGIVAVKLAP